MVGLPSPKWPQAFENDINLRAEGRELVVETGDVNDFLECADYAKTINDLDSLEFWLVEVATSRAELQTISSALFRLAQEVLGPQRRFHEGSVYLDYISRSLSGESETIALNLLTSFQNSALDGAEIVESDSWKTLDISNPLETGQTQQHYYDRFMAYFHAVHDERMISLFEELKLDFLPKIFGYFIGLTSSLKGKGVESETAIKAFTDYQRLNFKDFRPGIPKLKNSAPLNSAITPDASAEVSTKKDISAYGLSKG